MVRIRGDGNQLCHHDTVSLKDENGTFGLNEMLEKGVSQGAMDSGSGNMGLELLFRANSSVNPVTKLPEPVTNPSLTEPQGPTLADLQLLIDEESEEDLVDFEEDAGLMAGDDMDTEDVNHPESPATEQPFEAASPHPEEETEPSSSKKHELDDTRPITEKVLVEFGEYNNEWLYYQMEDANTDRHLEAAASYADFRGSMEEKQAELQTAFTSTDEKVSSLATSLEKLATDQGTNFTTILQTLTNLQQEFKDDPILVSKLLEFMDSHKATSKALSSLHDLFKGVDFQAIQTQQASVLTTLQAQESKITQLSSGYEQLTTKHNELVNCYTDKLAKLSETQQAMSTDLSNLKTETSEITGMVSDIFKQPYQVPPPPAQTAPVKPPPIASQSTDASTEAPTSVEGEKLTPTQRLFQHLDPHRQTQNESQATTTSVPTLTTEIITEAVPIRSFMPDSSTVLTTPILTEATTTTTELLESTFSTPSQADIGKQIKVTEDSPPKLIRATREVRRDPDEPILFEVTLHNGKVFRGTNEEVAAALEEDDKLKNELLSRPVISEVATEVIKETKKNIPGEHRLSGAFEMAMDWQGAPASPSSYTVMRILRFEIPIDPFPNTQ
ncbi:KH domain-containing protein [Artemisia annua]|uniref:KH domain-containing protein n=1 Tax=Artemisia annua TaxID=35608 RepID=A0A2U1LUM2_ARTAN|nr:KH domain-containing protein [Artemisia annua]